MNKFADYISRAIDAKENSNRGTGRSTEVRKMLQPGDCFVVHSYGSVHGVPDGVSVIWASTLEELKTKLRGLSFNRILFDNASLYLIMKDWASKLDDEIAIVCAPCIRKKDPIVYAD